MHLPDMSEEEIRMQTQVILNEVTDDTNKSAALQAILQRILDNNEIALVDKHTQAKKSVNPGPLGLIGFGMTTILLNVHNAGIYGLGSVVPAMGLALGGGLQLLVGLLEYFRGKSFPAVAFMSYGAFWLSLVAVWMLPQENHLHIQPSEKTFLGLYLFLWGLYTACMATVTFFTSHRLMQFLFSSLTLLFLLLALGDFTENSTITKIAGYEGIVCGTSAIYIAFSEILEDNIGHSILPLFPVRRD
ncbi:GPR1/FUN34/yaaH family protein [Trypanosoma grayi]|uniref:GPR1/FUN34/yaaH family protein n=1 Tax=Trypanosoma grayi TaxID=71804 RepID=UPI0004F45CDB|nr:GPR1/FUN34/yaaH family protein [Trypanosoma grayi]KEG10993.1 GPR1/FUN34/yaaH family protein [Trypanosoma grayi]